MPCPQPITPAPRRQTPASNDRKHFGIRCDRPGPGSDFATDTCIRREGIDPRTHSRYLEELAFEVVNTQSLPNMIERARVLTGCGVRRIFAIFVKKREVCEWSSTHDRFITLDFESAIEDRTLVRPLPIRALFDVAEADNSVARALRAKNNPILAEVRVEGLVEGRVEGIEVACRLLGLPLGPRERAHLDALDPVGLEALLGYLETERRWPEG